MTYLSLYLLKQLLSYYPTGSTATVAIQTSFPFISFVRVALFGERRGSKVYRLLLTANNFTIVYFLLQFFFQHGVNVSCTLDI